MPEPSPASSHLPALLKAVSEAVEIEQAREITKRTRYQGENIETGKPVGPLITTTFGRLTDEQITEIRRREAVAHHVAAEFNLPKPVTLETRAGFIKNESAWLDSMRKLQAGAEALLSLYGDATAPGQERSEGKAGAGSTKKRGRKPDTDPKEDKRIYDAWKTGHYRTKEALGQELEKTKRQVDLAIGRHRWRLRSKSRR